MCVCVCVEEGKVKSLALKATLAGVVTVIVKLCFLVSIDSKEKNLGGPEREGDVRFVCLSFHFVFL